MDARAGAMTHSYKDYVQRLNHQLSSFDWQQLDTLVDQLMLLWKHKARLFICGNGGSAGNATHLANDFLYGINPQGRSIDVEALPANSSVLTCLGNDLGYEYIFSHQLKVKGKSGDMLIVLSGSGNSANILNALQQARELSMTSWAVLGFCGGKALPMADNALHFAVDDMQISEDLQLVAGHMIMRELNRRMTGTDAK